LCLIANRFEEDMDMKYLCRQNIFFGLVLTLALVATEDQQVFAEMSQSGGLNLAITKVKSKSAQTLLGSDSIPVRNRNTTYMPSGEVQVLLLERPDESAIRLQLERVIDRHSPQLDRKVKLTRRKDILVAEAAEHHYWASLNSGAYKFTDSKDSMVNRSRLSDFKEAVQVALHFIAEKKVVDLTEGETLDIIFVSAVKNALTEFGKAEPLEEFLSDYYIIFGRRYRGIPVIGSRIMVRLKSDGKIAALERSWRPIESVSDKPARISKKPLQALIAQDPKFKQYSKKPVNPEDIAVIRRRCGYLEAPVSYQQAALRPGCIVSFRIGDQYAESYPQIIVPLEEGVRGEELWGPELIDFQ
jgi:hypothetical protein